MSRKYHIYLDEREYSRIIQSLISMKNSLMGQADIQTQLMIC